MEVEPLVGSYKLSTRKIDVKCQQILNVEFSREILYMTTIFQTGTGSSEFGTGAFGFQWYFVQ